MAQAEVEALLKRAERAEEKRQKFASLMQDCYAYAMPERDAWRGYAYAMPERDAWRGYGYGQDRQIEVFDSTAVLSVGRFANRLQQALFPPQQRWARLSLPPEVATAEDATPVQRDLEAATAVLFQHIHVSNFDQAVNEWAQDLAAGTACLLVENGRLGTRRTRAPLLRFQAVPSAMVAFDEGPWGDVEGVFFHQSLKARLLRRTYPDAEDLPDEVAQCERHDPDKAIELIQCTYYDAEDDLWRVEVLHKASKTRIVSRRYRTNPWIVTRWTKAPGETHGRGPLTQVLPDVKTVNRLVELALQAGSLAVGGVYTIVDDGVLNPANIAIEPGTFIPVRSNGGPLGKSVEALPFTGDYALNQALRESLIGRIRFGMFDDPLPPDVVPNVTATEIIERTRRFQADTGAFGRLQSDAVNPLVRRCLDILEEAGVFADPRFAGLMRAVQDDAVRIQATSPLAMAQDMADAEAVELFVARSQSAGEAGATMLKAGLKLDEAGPWLAARRGVPHALIPSQEERAAASEAEQAAASEAQLLSSPAVAQLAGAVGGALAQPAPVEEGAAP